MVIREGVEEKEEVRDRVRGGGREKFRREEVKSSSFRSCKIQRRGVRGEGGEA